MSWRACTNALGRLQQDSQDCFFFKGFPIPPKGQLCVTQSLTPSLSHDYPNLTLLPWVTQSLFRCQPRPAQRLPQENPRVGEPNPNPAPGHMDWSHHCHLQYRGPIAPSKHPHLGEKVSDFFLFTTPYLGGCPRLQRLYCVLGSRGYHLSLIKKTSVLCKLIDSNKLKDSHLTLLGEAH